MPATTRKRGNTILGFDAGHLSVEGLVNESLKPGGSVYLTLNDAVVNVVLDQKGDWTITVGISTKSDRLDRLSGSLQLMGFFPGTENEGILYFMWTSALREKTPDTRMLAEDTLVRVLKTFEDRTGSSYIS
jgi:hypothetical protein